MKMKLSLATALYSLLLLAGCTDGASEPGAESESEVAASEAITDLDTEPVVPIVTDVTADMVVYDYRYDSMDRGNYDYYEKEVVIDPSYYEENEFARGDVIAYKDSIDGSFTLTRIVGLPGEKVKIESGQIYVNGKQLDTFYGRYHRRGSDLEELKNMLAEGEYGFMQSKENIEANVSIAEKTDVEEVTVPEDHFYVIGDDWFRTQFRGLLSPEQIVGKVLGYDS
ncbi:signal peptidase I [Planococcus lenghuensis]|uniref:Signal peptidase I n=1 Tax=Planococcus lenghuensis TaxID=2213202 RepID=A0A1Q2L459_9BACL|nr:signal peptidase I [Planococcus lenghuensis]AQQ55245.1 signal peptidase I [Planococcus lenghuensis]